MDSAVKDPLHIQTSRRGPRRRLGQHMLTSTEIAKKLVEGAGIEDSDVVFEIGTGRGVLTEVAAAKAKKVISCDVDSGLLTEAKKRLAAFNNVTLIKGNAFRGELSETPFNSCISSLPYSRSREFIEWISVKRSNFRVAAVIVQDEFAKKLQAKPGLHEYRAISVIARLSFEVQTLFEIAPSCFVPPPKVMSCAIRLVPLSASLDGIAIRPKDIDLINRIFSFRGRVLRAAMRKIPELKRVSERLTGLERKRIENLVPQEFLLLVRETRKAESSS